MLAEHAIVAYLGSAVFELLLTSAAGYKAFKSDLFQFGKRISNGELADDLKSLAILLDLCDEFAYILICEAETIDLEGRILDKEALIKQLCVLKDIHHSLNLRHFFKLLLGVYLVLLSREVLSKRLHCPRHINLMKKELIYCLHIVHARSEADVDGICDFLQLPFLALKGVNAHYRLLRTKYPDFGFHRAAVVEVERVRDVSYWDRKLDKSLLREVEVIL